MRERYLKLVQIKDESEEYENEAVHFFNEIFKRDYNELFISDESSIYDFCWTDDMLDEKYKQIQEIYGVQIKDIEGLKIVDILQRIREGTGIT